MSKRFFFILGIIIVSCLFEACTKVPKGVISPKTMENILYDSYLGEGLSESELTQLYNPTDARKEYLFSVLKKYDVSKAEYDSSMTWYMQNLKVYVKIYDKVITRLKKEQKRVELEENSSPHKPVTAEGDTVNIWQRNHSALLNELPAFSHYLSTANANGFKPGDLFKLEADARLFKISGTRYPRVVLTVFYPNDSIQTMVRDIKNSSHIELILRSDQSKQVTKVVAGFTQNQRGILMVDSIRLNRIHVNAEPKKTVVNKVKPN